MRLFAQLNFGGNGEEAFRFWSIIHERPRTG